LFAAHAGFLARVAGRHKIGGATINNFVGWVLCAGRVGAMRSHALEH
jgi:hypothetical protein